VLLALCRTLMSRLALGETAAEQLWTLRCSAACVSLMPSHWYPWGRCFRLWTKWFLHSEKQRNQKIQRENAAGFFVFLSMMGPTTHLPPCGGEGEWQSESLLPLQLGPVFQGGVPRSDKYHKPKRADRQGTCSQFRCSFPWRRRDCSGAGRWSIFWHTCQPTLWYLSQWQFWVWWERWYCWDGWSKRCVSSKRGRAQVTRLLCGYVTAGIF